MKYYGKAEQVAGAIVDAFSAGKVPKALAQVYIHRKDNVPCRAWSASNQFITALIGGTADARGFRQWQEVGRCVRKGAHAFHILAPCVKTTTERDPSDGSEKEHRQLFGFRAVPVFALESTDVTDAGKWEKATQADREAENWLASLPLRPVADAWGLKVTSYNGEHAGYLGAYRPGQSISVGVENLSTWAHELVHAADDRVQKGLRPGQQADQEIVAELGGAVLLEMLGHQREADRGGAWDYIQSYAGKSEGKAVSAALGLIKRICACVDLILSTAEELDGRPVTVPAETAG